MKHLELALGLLLAGSVASAADCGGFTPDALKEMAREWVLQDLAGVRLLEPGACLEQLKLKYTQVAHDPIQMAGKSLQEVADDVEVRVAAVKTDGTPARRATARFEVLLGGQWVADQLSFMLNLDPQVQNSQGCAGVLDYPQKWRVRQGCSRSLQKGR